uniref:Uncharacterized protein n=1 Tax=Ditylenchus dipsaci TaxID=166011 RepID=A0A915DVX5_9BILA
MIRRIGVAGALVKEDQQKMMNLFSQMENLMQVPIPMVTCTNPAPDQVLANPAEKQSGLSCPPTTSNGCCHLWSTDWPATVPTSSGSPLGCWC